MKLQYKNQAFQSDAAKAIVDVFAGQPRLTPSYMIDRGKGDYQHNMKSNKDAIESSPSEEDLFTGWSNHPIVSNLSSQRILEQLNRVQRNNQIKPSERLEGLSAPNYGFNLTVEMETGVGKTYTYIKTMYELYKAYGWCKYIIVVPSIAIREGVYKSFQMTEDHFAELYGERIRYFIYNSAQLEKINQFASENKINVMIINSQAFNARGADARRITMELDNFRSRRPIDVIKKTNPILIIDEPQSVEGKQTKERLRDFNPLLTIRYSATHKSDNIYNMVYRLDAMDAYNKRLVKKIAVKGITETRNSATNGYLYLERLNFSSSAPTATLHFDHKLQSRTTVKSRICSEGDNLYDLSKNLTEYKNGYVIKTIDGRDDSVEFVNGLKIHAGEVVGKVNEDALRRIQIRETILSHIDRERHLFKKGIKVLSLFFIDEVANYRQYENGQAVNGKYAELFEQEYNDVVENYQFSFDDDEYVQYLKSIPASKTHAGYFSIDGKGKMVNCKVGKKETTSDDVSAYDLIMKNKELLLDRNPERSPVRFIFSHSALREGWDNPNVFQICTLKQSSSEIRKRQEVGRGLRLCVNQNGERMDAVSIGGDVHRVNVLTVIASESYESFVKGLQTELAEAVANRPQRVTINLFINKTLIKPNGEKQVIDEPMAQKIYNNLVINKYVDDNGALTDQYYTDKAKSEFKTARDLEESANSIINVLDTVYDPKNSIPAENARSSNVELQLDKEKIAMPEFKALWNNINSKTFYTVDFDTDELVKNSIRALDLKLRISPLNYYVSSGTLENIASKEDLESGNAFVNNTRKSYKAFDVENSSIRYDLLKEMVAQTGLTRKTIADILQGIAPETFHLFLENPEEFILQASELINYEKATTIVQHITYNLLEDRYNMDAIFNVPDMKGKIGVNAIKTKKHLYDHVVYDSKIEKDFASGLENENRIAVYVKLPKTFFIPTPVGNYNPDWAIAFYEGSVKHIYFVAETKGSMNSMQLREIEKKKIELATKHFQAISQGNVTYDVVNSYNALMEKVMK